jgi:hypothetical protein
LFIGLPEDHECGQDSESEADSGHLRRNVVPVRKQHYTDNQQRCDSSSAEADDLSSPESNMGTPSYLLTTFPSARAGPGCREGTRRTPHRSFAAGEERRAWIRTLISSGRQRAPTTNWHRLRSRAAVARPTAPTCTRPTLAWRRRAGSSTEEPEGAASRGRLIPFGHCRATRSPGIESLQRLLNATRRGDGDGHPRRRRGQV